MRRRAAAFVYLFRAENGLVKIGKTVNIQQRFKSIHTMSPIDIEVFAFLETEMADELEYELHIEFDVDRVKGEWFNLSDEDLQYIVEKYGFEVV